MVVLQNRVDKTKNNSGGSIFFLLIWAKKTLNQTKIKLHIQAPGKNVRCHGDRAPRISLPLKSGYEKMECYNSDISGGLGTA
jgi:hypothetical protein